MLCLHYIQHTITEYLTMFWFAMLMYEYMNLSFNSEKVQKMGNVNIGVPLCYKHTS